MPSNYSALSVDWFDASDSYSSTINIVQHVKSIPSFTDTGTGEVNQATIILRSLKGRFLTAVAWATSTSYFLDDRVKESNKFYLCVTAHTSGTFSVDLANAKWIQEPDLDIHDRFRIQVTDVGGNTYDRYFELMNFIPSQTKSEGSIVTLDLAGIEYHTQQIHMAKPYYFEDAFTVAQNIADFYNNNKGKDQPFLSNADIGFTGTPGKGNGLPFWTANNYEYAVSEDRIYNRWMDVIEKLGSSVSVGGALTFYELSFETTAVNAMDFKLRKTGSNTVTVTIKNSKVTNPKTVGEQEGELLNPTGTNVIAWGSPDHGSLPVGFSKYYSNLMFFIFRPEWVTGVDYLVDSRIKVTISNIAKHYKALENHTSGTFATDLTASKWVQIDQAEEFGNTESYSPWTDDKAVLWGNNGADPDRTNHTNAAWFDMNIVINDQISWFRTWVDVRANSDSDLNTFAAVASEGYSYETISGNIRDRWPNGFRILVEGSGSGDLSAFTDQVVEWRRTAPTSYSWQVLYDFGTATDDKVKVQIAVLDEGKLYDGTDFNTTPVWTSIDTKNYANDCFHPYSLVPSEVDGIDFVSINNVHKQRADITDSTNRPDITKAGGTFTKNKKSGILFNATSTGVTDLPTSWALGDFYYKQGIGFNIRFPFPSNNYNGISEDVGEIWGGGGPSNWTTSTAYVIGNKVVESTNWYMCIEAHTSGTFNTDLNTNHFWRNYFPEPSVLDIQNMGICGDGQIGFNRGGSSEDLGPINAVAFWLKISRVSAGIEWNGEHPFRCWFCDTKDNVVYQDFIVSHSLEYRDIRLPISGFRPYKGIKPVYGFDAAISPFFSPNDVEVFDIFEWRNIKLGGVQYQAFYDEHGRFNPGKALITTGPDNVVWSQIFTEISNLSLDGFRFIKPLLTSSGQEPTRNIEPDFLQRPNITLYHQLQNDAKSQLEIEKFRHKEFTAETSGEDIFDVRFGESYYLFNEDLISDSDNGANTIKLVAKRIEYSITKPEVGRGGLRRRIMGSKVFT